MRSINAISTMSKPLQQPAASYAGVTGIARYLRASTVHGENSASQITVTIARQ